MKIEEAKERMATVKPTKDDEKSFETFQPLAEALKKFEESGDVVLTTKVEPRELTVGDAKRSVSELYFEPEGAENATPVRMIMAYNSRNFYIGEENLRTIGERDIDAAFASLAAFKVKSVEPTGLYPMRRSKAAENLGYVPSKKLTQDEWGKLREEYSDDANKVAAKGEVFNATEAFEIHKFNIEVVD